MVPETTLQPDTDAIRHDLEFMTARWSELPEAAVFEIRAFKEGSQTQTAKFAADWMDEAIDWIANMNRLGFNIYAVRNPIRHSVNGSAKDTDIIGSFFLWADCDDDDSASNVKRFDGPKYTAAVTTGRTPSPRVHVYWALEEPCYDLDAWRAMQVRVAAHFNSDRSVINPSRIMRVGGTVTYPAKKKRERGYVSEVTTFRSEYDEPRKPVTLDQMGRVFKAAAPAVSTRTDHVSVFEIDTMDQPLNREQMRIQALSGSVGGFTIDTMPHPTLDRALAAADIVAGKDWRENVKSLVASYVARGWTDDEILVRCAAFTLPGWTDEETKDDVLAFIKWTREQEALNGGKYAVSPKPDFTPNFDHSPAPTATDQSPQETTWKIQHARDFVADFVSPEYIIDGIVQRGRLHTFTAPTGSGKTAVMLYAAMCIASGEQFCGLEVERGSVLFLAGENPDDVRARMIGTLEHYGIDPATIDMHFIAGTFSIRRDLERLAEEAEKLPNLTLIVVDTFAAYFDGEDENSNAQALDFARVVRSLTQVESKPAVIMPAHPVKGAHRGNLAPKGGSSLVNEVDSNLTLWNADGLLTMHWQVKHRGPNFEPLTLEFKRHESDSLLDKKGRRIPTILAQPVLTQRATEIARDTLSMEDQILLAIMDDPGATKRERAYALNIPASRYQRIIESLYRQKLIKKFRSKWELTKDGERAVEEIISGEIQPADLD